MSTVFIPRDKLQRRIYELQQQAQQEGFHQGQRVGLKEGQRQGAAIIVTIALEQRFGPLDAELHHWVTELSLTNLKALARQVPHIASLADLEGWLEARLAAST